MAVCTLDLYDLWKVNGKSHGYQPIKTIGSIDITQPGYLT
jgi:hypothetical protein